VSVSAGIAVLAAVTALAAAARSTWSPCGLSMLSTITPLAEASRGRRFRRTAAWFVLGALVGGATLGLGAAVLAGLVGALDLPAAALAGVAAAASAVALACDARLGGLRTPGHIRQVDEDWLERFRPWVYGAGFGWQIGVGLATYIMTAAIYLTVVLAALTGRPLVALGIGCLFGLARGFAILLGARITSPAALVDFHRRFDALGEPVRRAVIAVEGGVALSAASAAIGAGPALPATLLVATLVAAAVLLLRPATAADAASQAAGAHPDGQPNGASAVTPAT
jgi:hypothetical protein